MKTPAKHWQSRTKRDLIIEVWEALDCESVGARELEQIQRVLSETLGAGAIESPAAIARVVADEGAALRHPEVFECDFKLEGGRLTVPTKPGLGIRFNKQAAAKFPADMTEPPHWHREDGSFTNY